MSHFFSNPGSLKFELDFIKNFGIAVAMAALFTASADGNSGRPAGKGNGRRNTHGLFYKSKKVKRQQSFVAFFLG